MEFLSNYMSFRSSYVENLKKQIFPEREVHLGRQGFSHSPTSKDKKRNANITSMMEAVQSKEMASLEACGLWNFLKEKEATTEQSYDLLNIRHIGQAAYERYVSPKIIGLPSTPAPNRKKKTGYIQYNKSPEAKG